MVTFGMGIVLCTGVPPVGDLSKPEFKARIIHGEYKGGIIEECMDFCRIWDGNVLKANRPEVEKIMMTMFGPEYVKMTAERGRRR